jgi:hypothetical protein
MFVAVVVSTWVTSRLSPPPLSPPPCEASIRKKSRDVVSVQLDQSRLNQGILGLSWNILEKNDGAVIQLVYAGPPSIHLIASGVIEGQTGISRPPEWQGTSSLLKDKPFSQRSFGWLMIGMGLLMFSFPLMLSRYRGTFFDRHTSALRWGRVVVLLAPPLLYVCTGIFTLVFGQPNPPFGF